MSQLANLITAKTAKGTAKAMHFAAAFDADSFHLVTANNDQELMKAIGALPMQKTTGLVSSPELAVLGDAIGAASKAMREALPGGVGWIGAKNGAFSKASKDARAPYLHAHEEAKRVFREVLAASPLWRDLTEEEKSQKAEEAKAKKAKKAEEAKAEEAAKVASIRAALVESGELVPADALPLTIGKASAAELIGALLAIHDGEGTPLNSPTVPDLLVGALVALHADGALLPWERIAGLLEGSDTPAT